MIRARFILLLFLISWFITCGNNTDTGRNGTQENVESTPTTHTAEAQEKLLQPEDLQYQGAFLLPKEIYGASRWGYGGMALTFYPKGDEKSSNDGYPGSLFGSGHVYDNLVGECSIPQPIISPNKALQELPIATQLQDFMDITQGLKNTILAPEDMNVFGGLVYIADGDWLYWSFFQYYSVQPPGDIDYASHGRSKRDLAHPEAQGVWHIGPFGTEPFHQKKTANYMFEIPKNWAGNYTQGMSIATGKGDGPGLAANSYGPALFAVEPPSNDSNPKNDSVLPATVLLYYPAAPENSPQYFPQWSECDSWEGAVWISSHGKSGVLFAGRRGRGPTCYGEAAACNDSCSIYKGYHCYPYEPEFVFYDPKDLALVAQGKIQSQEIIPYAHLNLTSAFFSSCNYGVGGAAFDQENGILYVIQQNAEDPIVHVWAIKGES